MKLRVTALVGALFALLLVLPTSGARFTDATGSAGNTIAYAAPGGPIRSTTYRVQCEDTACNVNLNQDLARDYFVLLRGSAGGTDAQDDYVRVEADPFGTGRLNELEETDVIRLVRWSGDAWNGDVTVVESLAQQDTAGFRLVDAAVVEMSAKKKVASIAGSWANESQVGLYGGSMGGGMTVDGADHASGWARIWPEDSNIRLRRASADSTAKFTVYAVEWGSEWTIQHVHVQGHNGGEGVGGTSTYNTATLPTNVTREQTFVLAYGSTQESTAGTGWEAQIYTLGDGTNVNATESQVAIGGEYSEKRDAEIYTHSHPRLFVDYAYGTIAASDGGGSIGVASALGPEENDGSSTGDLRFPILANSSREDSSDDAQPIAWARHTGTTTVSWARTAAGETGSYWLQSVDFANIWN